jgi:hypothetical protein
MASALNFLERYHTNGDEFLNYILRVTGGETWASFVNVETKRAAKAEGAQTSTKQAEKF